MQHIAAMLSELGERLQARSEDSLAQAVVEATAELLPGARCSSISVNHAGRLKSLVVSDDLARRLDQLPYEAGEGPCVDAVIEDSMFVSSDLARGARWPAFSRGAVALGIRSVLAYRLDLWVNSGLAAACATASGACGRLTRSLFRLLHCVA